MNFGHLLTAVKRDSIKLPICGLNMQLKQLVLGIAFLFLLDNSSVNGQDNLPLPENVALPALNGFAQLPDPLPEDSLVHGVVAQRDRDSDSRTADSITDDRTVHLPESADLPTAAESSFIDYLALETKKLTSREGTGSSLKLVLLLGALSLAPAGLLMTTCYVRIIVVLSLLRQAFGAQQLPPNQVIAALSLFLTLLVMMPVWQQVKSEAIDPYATSEQMDWQEAWQRGIVPVKKFMGHQIEIAKNGNSIAMFYKYLPPLQANGPPSRIEDVPITVLLPAFIVSELKVAFLLGFQIFLPFLVLDFVVSTVTVSMGMLMLPPTMVSFPLKLILFVMVDGWSLVVGMLLQSFGPFS